MKKFLDSEQGLRMTEDAELAAYLLADPELIAMAKEFYRCDRDVGGTPTYGGTREAEAIEQSADSSYGSSGDIPPSPPSFFSAYETHATQFVALLAGWKRGWCAHKHRRAAALTLRKRGFSPETIPEAFTVDRKLRQSIGSKRRGPGPSDTMPRVRYKPRLIKWILQKSPEENREYLEKLTAKQLRTYGQRFET